MKKKEAVTFKAHVWRIQSTSLRSADKGTRLILEIDNPSNELLDSLNRLHIPGEGQDINVGFWK